MRVPKQICSDSQFRIALAHTDFPTLKITPNPDAAAAGVRTLHPEIYGSPLFTSWLDRDLGYAGLLAYELDGKLETKLIRGDKLFRIPQLAVHLNRGVNQDGLTFGDSPYQAYSTFAGNPYFIDLEMLCEEGPNVKV